MLLRTAGAQLTTFLVDQHQATLGHIHLHTNNRLIYMNFKPTVQGAAAAPYAPALLTNPLTGGIAV